MEALAVLTGPRRSRHLGRVTDDARAKALARS